MDEEEDEEAEEEVGHSGSAHSRVTLTRGEESSAAALILTFDPNAAMQANGFSMLFEFFC